jgi:hypothetical protein
MDNIPGITGIPGTTILSMILTVCCQDISGDIESISSAIYPVLL